VVKNTGSVQIILISMDLLKSRCKRRLERWDERGKIRGIACDYSIKIGGRKSAEKGRII